MDEIEPTLPEGIPHVFISSVTGLGISVLKDILWMELIKGSNEIASASHIAHRSKDVGRLREELKAQGEDEEFIYEDNGEDEDDIEYEYEDDQEDE
jgi:GTP-binding protein